MFFGYKELSEAVTAFFDKINELLARIGFEDYVEQVCRRCYSEILERPSLALCVCFQLLAPADQMAGITLSGADARRVRRPWGRCWRRSSCGAPGGAQGKQSMVRKSLETVVTVGQPVRKAVESHGRQGHLNHRLLSLDV